MPNKRWSVFVLGEFGHRFWFALVAEILLGDWGKLTDDVFGDFG